MTRVMLVLPTATYRATAFLRAAADLGLEPVVVSEEAPTLAARMEGRVLTVDPGQPARARALAADFARSWPVDAVVGVDESSVLVAAEIADALGLARNPVSAVAITRDKRLLRSCLAHAGLAQPRWTEVRAAAGTEVAERAAAEVGLPCVVKPVDLAASRGVIRADTVDELAAALQRTDTLLQRPDLCGPDGDRPLLVESFIPGAEIALEGLLRDGRLEVLAIFDKPDPLDGPFFAETLYVTPSRHDADVIGAAIELTRRALGAIGLRDGPVHAELRLAPDGPVFIEVAARSIGGRCSAALRLRDGAVEMSLEEAILRHACGLPLRGLQRAGGGAGVLMLPVPRAGVLRSVTGIARATAVPGVTGVEVSIPPGQAVEPLPEGDRYLGFVTSTGDSAATAEASLRAAWELLVVVVDAAGAEHSAPPPSASPSTC